MSAPYKVQPVDTNGMRTYEVRHIDGRGFGQYMVPDPAVRRAAWLNQLAEKQEVAQ